MQHRLRSTWEVKSMNKSSSLTKVDMQENFHNSVWKLVKLLGMKLCVMEQQINFINREQLHIYRIIK